MKVRVRVGNQEIDLSNLGKIFWPESGYTKGDLVDYYTRVAPVLLPHLRDRPLVVTRYPDGITGKAFYQKNLPDHTPEWVGTFPYYSPHSARTINFCVVHNLETLVWLSNQACLELHPWLSRCDRPDYPDYAVFDLDPDPPAGYDDAVEVAKTVKTLLDELRLAAGLKTSGATGLHIYVPLARSYTYEVVRRFVEEVGRLIERVLPEKVTLERTVGRRKGKVYIDYLQNVRGKTIVAPYSVRPLEGAPVSAPITWDELDHVAPRALNIKTIPDRIRQVGDVFRSTLGRGQNLDQALKDLGIEEI